MQTGLRFTVTMPLAALATAGLFIGMKALITGEFAPQTKLAAAKFEINPVAEDIIPDARVTKVAELKTIETPPPPPIIERTFMILTPKKSYFPNLRFKKVTAMPRQLSASPLICRRAPNARAIANFALM
jgi:hypothetical protein